MGQIKEAGINALSMQHVHVKPEYWVKRKMGKTAVCPSCGESFPVRDGESCLSCQGRSPYIA